MPEFWSHHLPSFGQDWVGTCHQRLAQLCQLGKRFWQNLASLTAVQNPDKEKRRMEMVWGAEMSIITPTQMEPTPVVLPAAAFLSPLWNGWA